MKMDQELLIGLVKSHISSMLQAMSLATAVCGEELYESIRKDAAASGDPLDRETGDRLIALLNALGAQLEAAVEQSRTK